MIVDCISDLHGNYPKLEGGDLLIVAGDLTSRDLPYAYVQFGLWLSQQKYERKIVIGGNHDNLIEKTPKIFEGLPNFAFNYLCDSGTDFEGLRIWGSPWTKTFPGMNPHCKAFAVDTEQELAEKWALIPDDTDILITHGPPYGILDKCDNGHVGSLSLRNSVLAGEKMENLKLHIFGHIHEEGGKMITTTLTKFVNCSHVNEHYKPVNKPVRIVL